MAINPFLSVLPASTQGSAAHAMPNLAAGASTPNDAAVVPASPLPAALPENPRSADEAIKTINAQLQFWSTNLRFDIDADLNRLVVSVIDSQSGEVLRSVPSEAAIRFAKVIANLQGKFVDTAA